MVRSVRRRSVRAQCAAQEHRGGADPVEAQPGPDRQSDAGEDRLHMDLHGPGKGQRFRGLHSAHLRREALEVGRELILMSRKALLRYIAGCYMLGLLLALLYMVYTVDRKSTRLTSSH